MMASVLRRAAIYARVSTTNQTAAYQVRELGAAAQRMGWEIAIAPTDDGTSGANGRDQRPELDQLFRMAQR